MWQNLKDMFTFNPLIAPDYVARLTLTFLDILAGLSYTIGPKTWHTGPVYSTTEFLHVPIQIYGIMLLISAALLIFAPFIYKALAYILGGVVYTTFAMCLIIHFQIHGTVSLSSIGITVAVAAWYWTCGYRANNMIGKVEK